MTIRVTTYLDEDIAKKMDRYENKSKLVKDALNMYFINKDYFLSKKKIVENTIRDYEYKLENEKFKLKLIEKEIEDIDRRKNNRPNDYQKVVYTLKALPNITDKDLEFQAEQLHVDVGQLKEWLWFDGYFKDIFGTE